MVMNEEFSDAVVVSLVEGLGVSPYIRWAVGKPTAQLKPEYRFVVELKEWEYSAGGEFMRMQVELEHIASRTRVPKRSSRFV